MDTVKRQWKLQWFDLRTMSPFIWCEVLSVPWHSWVLRLRGSVFPQFSKFSSGKGQDDLERTSGINQLTEDAAIACLSPAIWFADRNQVPELPEGRQCSVEQRQVEQSSLCGNVNTRVWKGHVIVTSIPKASKTRKRSSGKNWRLLHAWQSSLSKPIAGTSHFAPTKPDQNLSSPVGWRNLSANVTPGRKRRRRQGIMQKVPVSFLSAHRNSWLFEAKLFLCFHFHCVIFGKELLVVIWWI